jgi:hypothetical protein
VKLDRAWFTVKALHPLGFGQYRHVTLDARTFGAAGSVMEKASTSPRSRKRSMTLATEIPAKKTEP